MITIREDSILDAWKAIKAEIKRNGRDVIDDDEELLEVMNVFVEIRNPYDRDPELDEVDPDMREWMCDNFHGIKKVHELGNSWSYGWRLYHYDGEVNQIEYIAAKLERKPETKSATITTLIRPGLESYVPCVSLLDFKIREGKLILTATCRSIDIGKKGLFNMIELASILNRMAARLMIDDAQLNIHIISAHIYKKDVESG